MRFKEREVIPWGHICRYHSKNQISTKMIGHSINNSKQQNNRGIDFQEGKDLLYCHGLKAKAGYTAMSGGVSFLLANNTV